MTFCYIIYRTHGFTVESLFKLLCPLLLILLLLLDPADQEGRGVRGEGGRGEGGQGVNLDLLQQSYNSLQYPFSGYKNIQAWDLS